MNLEQVKDMLKSVADAAKVETVFGEPREVAGKTIIPVARVAYGGGGGGGQGQCGEGGTGTGTGGGGGMGVNVQPIGVFVISPEGERYVALLDLTRVILAGSMVALAGILTVRKVLMSKQKSRWMAQRWMAHRWMRHKGKHHGRWREERMGEAA